ncbi:histidine phosphatase family protein [Cryobacterium lactosi]|uniref:Histidine phosphatase family protein n=1 Tax=Cryobacterium lactosi TaxID=1259202 RepID=A0A4R9BTJ1_9MICO|nr:histidine phosphatase family protein [Cryobacterium lactosi]TFD90692.1 histidine phosphatase family protein [Cryobacterium lactosi]
MASEAGLGQQQRQGHGGGVISILLVRHGESAANVAATAAEAAAAEVVVMPLRDADVPLTETGTEQAHAVRRWLDAQPDQAYPDSVWASPYLRAAETARIALGSRPNGPRQVHDERLRDRELGILDLLTTRGVRARLPSEAARRDRLGKFYYRPPGGESWADVALRLRSFLAELDADSVGPSALVVSHDAVIMLFRMIAEGLTEPETLRLAGTEPLLNASITRLVRDDRHSPWRVHTYNDVSHLVSAGVGVTAHTSAKDPHAAAE